MTSRYYTMTDSTGASGFLPTVTFDGSGGVFTSAHRTNTLSSIGITGFYEADFADTVTVIDLSAFLFDTKVVVATINKVTTIGENAFNGCSAMRSITLDTAIDASSKRYLLTSIGTSAFSGCTSLRNLHIPDTVKQIPGGMCFGCSNLEIAVMGYGCGSRDANDNYIVDGSIGSYAFANCPKLSFFIIPETVGSVGNNAFENDPLLSYVAILGKPTFGTTVFGGTTLNTSSARYVYDITMTNKTFVPTSATKNEYYEYEFTASSGTTITPANVKSRFDGLSPVPTWVKVKLKGTGTGYVATIGEGAFRPFEITSAHYSKIIGFSLHSSITTIQYGAFEAYNGSATIGTLCNMAAHYIPNSVTTTSPNASSNSFTFSLVDDANVGASQTRQIVFQSGTNKIQLGYYTFRRNSARAIIIYDIASTNATGTLKGIPTGCCQYCFYLQFCNFFQKNAYSTFTRINTNAFQASLMLGWTGSGTHYVYIPKQIEGTGFAYCFTDTNSNILFTVYDKHLDGTAGTGLESLGSNIAGTGSYLMVTYLGASAATATVHLICNWNDANGTLNGSFKAVEYNYHLLFRPSITTITNRFAGNANLKSIAIHHSAPQTVVINTGAFLTCTNLNYVYLNNRVKTIGINAFRNTLLSNTFDLIDAHPLEAIYHAAFYIDPAYTASNLRQITIPNTVKAIGSFAVGASVLGKKASFTTLSFENGIAFWGDYNHTLGDISTITGYGSPDINHVGYMAIPAYFCLNCANLTSVSFLNTIDSGGNAILADGNGALVRPDNNFPIPTRYNSQILTTPIRRIGTSAFQYNYRLQSIRIPDGVTIIDTNAFYDAYSLSYLYLPDSLTTMALDSAAFNYLGASNQFSYTGREVAIRIPQLFIDYIKADTGNTALGTFNTLNVTNTKLYVTVNFNTSSGKVSGTTLGRFTSQPVNTYIKYHVITLSGITGILGSFSASTRAFDRITSLKTVTIADTVTNIGPGAAESCTGLTNVYISTTSNLTTINDSAFYNCTSLTDIYLGNQLQTIGVNAFRNVPLSNTFDLSSATSLRAIYYAAFMTENGYTSNIRQITIPNSVQLLGANVFDCSQTGIATGLKASFTTLSFQNGIAFWGDYDGSVGAATFTDTNTGSARYMAIPANFCRKCDYLTSINFLNTAIDVNGTPVPNDGLALARPDNNLPIPTRYNTQTLTNYIRRIGVSAFESNYRLQSIRIPQGVTNIDLQAFYDAYSLSYLYLPDSLTTIGSSAFNYAGIDNKYSYTGKEISIRIPQSKIDDVSLNKFATYNGSVFYVTVAFDNTTASGKVSGTTLGRFTTSAVNSTIKYHVITLSGITGILGGSTTNARAFDGITSLKTVTIADTVTSIGASALYNCTGLTNVLYYSSNSNLVTIGSNAFFLCTSLTTITIPSLVTDISSSAFRSCTSLTSVSFSSPGSLVNIGESAFSYCTSLTDISINRAKSIGPYAFFNAPLSNTFDLSGATSLEAIYSSAFYTDTGTSNLRQITIPSSVTALGSYAFACSAIGLKPAFTSLSFQNGIIFWGDYDNTLVSFTTTASYGYPSTSSATYMAIPASFCQACDKLTSIANVLNKNPIRMGDSAFQNCKKITTITIPDSITIIGTSAFYDCSGLTSVSFSPTGALVTIGSSAFQSCTSLTDISINRAKSIGTYAFSNAPLSNTFDLSGATSLEAIYFAAFYTDASGTSNLRQITIPSSVKALGSYAFACSALGLKSSFTSLSLQNGIIFWGDYNNALSLATTTVSYEVLNTSSLKYMAIPSYFCYNCDYLTSVSFLNTVDGNGNAILADSNGALARPNNRAPIPTRYNSQTLTTPINRIGTYAFISNHRLQSIRIPDGVTIIDGQAFYDAHSLSYLYLPDSLTTIGVDAFDNLGITNKFLYTGKEVSIRIPQLFIDDVSSNKFNTSNISTYFFTVPFDNTSSKVTSNVLGRFTSQPVNTYIKYHVVTLNGITGILGGSTANARAFDGYTSLQTVTIADTVTNIGVSCLSGCTGLTNIFISPTSNLTFIGASAFTGCTALTSFFIPNSLDGINANTFSGCTSLATVTYGDNPGIKYIGNNAFYDTTKTLASIFIPSSVVYIGNSAFITSSNTNVNILNTVTFGAGSRLKSIDSYCFGCSGRSVSTFLLTAAQYLRDIVLPSSLCYIGTSQAATDTTIGSPFQNTYRLNHSARFVVPSSVEVIPWAFLYTDGGTVDISDVYFPLSITTVSGPRKHNGYSLSGGLIGAEFKESKSGSLIYLPSGLSGYTGRSGITFPNTGRTRSYYKTVSYTTNPLTTLSLSLTIPANTTDATNTTQIHADIQDGVVVIGGGTTSIAGTGNSPLNLISANIPSTVTDICANAFNGCSALAYVTFSENSHLTTIGNSAFLGCSLISDIQLPDTLTTIGPNAFSGCYNLASISIPYNVTSIGQNAFNINNNTPTTYIARPAACLAYQLGQDIYGEAYLNSSGYSVSLSSDGKILAIGATLNDASAGQVRVYKYQTITDTTWANYTINSFFQNGTSPYNKPIVVNGGDALPVSGKYYWVQLGNDINGETTYNYSGWTVSLSSDGTTVAIGALVNSGAGADAGQVRVYKYQTIADATWTNYTTNSFTYVTNKPIVVNGGDANPVANKSYWVQLGADIDGETANSQSGNSVSLSSNGTILAVGARLDDLNSRTNSGSVRVYEYSSGTGTWSKIGSAITGGALANDEFGWSVSLSDDGTVVAIGAHYADSNGDDAGTVRIYTNISNTWTQRGSNIIGEATFDYSGMSVSLNFDGTIVAIGAIGNDGGANNGGQVRVYKYTTAWNKLGQDIDGLAASDEFGNSVSLNSDGTILVVGSRSSDNGSVSDAGLARIYKYIGTTWQQLGQDIRGYYVSDNAGYSVSLSKDGTTVAIGARGNDGNGTDSGVVRVYQINQFTIPIRLHERLYNDISGSLTTYFPGIYTGSVQVIPALTLTNTLNPAKLTISQISNLYIRYRQSQLGFCTFITVSASYGDGILRAIDITTALSGTTGLVHLDISTNVTSIDGEVCLNNTRIYSVAISKTVVTFGTSVFNGCTNLTYLSFHPDSVCTTIGDSAFYRTNIIDLALPDSLTTILASAFFQSKSLTSVCIPKNVTSLDINVFANCPSLTSVALPSSLSTANTSSYFNTNGTTAPGTFTIYDMNAAIPHFKLSDYSMPNGIVQNVVDSAVTYIDHLAYAYYPDITLYAVTTNKQTQTAGHFNYVMNGIKMPFQPAAFMLNGGSVVSNSMFPIYRSVPDLNVFSLDSTATNWSDNGDDFYILMPGYSICIYNNLYDEENLFTDTPTYQYYDNEFGKVPLNITINVANTTSSILIMYKGRILSKYFST